MITKQHTYGLIYKFSRYLSGFFSFISILLGLFLTVGLIISLIEGDEFDSSSIMTILGNILGIAIWAPIFYLFFAYLMTDINVDNDGMYIPFLWKNYLIKWDEIIEVKPLKPFGLFTNKRSNVVFVKTKLTFFHHLYGILYGGKNQSAILIYRTISDYDLLIKSVSTQARKNQRNMSENKSMNSVSN